MHRKLPISITTVYRTQQDRTTQGFKAVRVRLCVLAQSCVLSQSFVLSPSFFFCPFPPFFVKVMFFIETAGTY
jgi:hypothetical protein